MLKRIKKGLERFQKHTYKEYETLYHKLESTQHPHTLFIACSDSRVSPEWLMDTEPGEVFTVRNIANTVPSYETGPNDVTTLSTIEYAVEVLEVEEIIICGHSNCGGCAAALLEEEQLTHLPYTKDYLKPLKLVREKMEQEASNESPAAKARLMEQLNVVEQMNHLKEFPFIKKRMEKGELEIEGWRYDIGTGEIAVYDEQKEQFIPYISH